MSSISHYNCEPERPEIALSWQRSRLNGVEPLAGLVDGTTDWDTESRLIRAAKPVLEDAAGQIADTKTFLILTDRDCRVIASVFGDDQLRNRLEGLGVSPGILLGEDNVGTNGLGTPREIGQGIHIHGDEHFLEAFKGLSCYGLPIIHPVTHRLEGVLDISHPERRANPLFAPYLTRAVADIESRLAEGARQSELKLVEAFQNESARNRLAVTALADDMVLSNRAALNLLDGADQATLRRLLSTYESPGQRKDTIALASGEQATVYGNRISGAEGGAVFVIEPLRRRRPLVPRSTARAAAAREHHEPLDRALTAPAVVVTGEAGSGRTTAAAAIVGTSPATWLDASRQPTTGDEGWEDLITAASGDSNRILVVENADLLPDALMPLVADLLDELALPRIVLTCGPLDGLVSQAAAVMARCRSRVVTTPLRERRTELPGVIRTMVHRLEPGVTVSPDAVEALSAGDWPGNLVELENVLDSALAGRAGSRITTADLPESYRTSARVARLSGWELAERGAIIGALRNCNGNKVHAAAQLGISRSTLYLKLRSLDIPFDSARTDVRTSDS